MKKSKGSHPLRFIKRHTVALSIIFVALIVAGGGIFWLTQTVNAQVAELNSKTKGNATAAADMVKTRELREKKKAEEALAAKQAAEVKQAAEQAKTDQSSTATATDPKTCNALTVHNNPALIDVVVNKKHCIQPLS
jgi:uncharacterized protein HemX